jgi:hypothetical protein
MGPDDAAATPDPHVFGDLTEDNRRRLRAILSEQLPEVFELDRIIEQKTGYASEICKQMKIDVLSHLATLAKRQHELDHDQQASQLAKIEEHLRRAIVEHPEEVLRNRIADIEEAWVVYQQEAFIYREKNELHGVPRHKELEELRLRINAHLEAARKTKPDETTWDESLDAAAQVTEGADLASDLADKLNQCIGEARRLRRAEEEAAAATQTHSNERRTDKKRFVIGIAAAAIIAVGSVFGAYFLGKGASDSPAAGHQTKHHAQR